MIVRCAPDIMKDLMAASSVQSERVQKVLCASRNMLTARLPLARRACSADRNAATKKNGRYFHDLTRRRVIETNGMCPPNLWPEEFLLRRACLANGKFLGLHSRPLFARCAGRSKAAIDIIPLHSDSNHLFPDSRRTTYLTRLKLTVAMLNLRRRRAGPFRVFQAVRRPR